MFDRKALKAEAKLRMKESEPRYWKVMLIWFLVAALAPAVIMGVVGSPLEQAMLMMAGGIHPGMALSLVGGTIALAAVLGIVFALYQIVMSFGLARYALKLWRKEECGERTLFEGFAFVWRVIGTNLLVALFTILWSLLLVIPYAVIVAVGAWLGNGFGIFLMVVGYIAFIVGLIVIVLRYALVNYALADQPELGALGAIQRSKELMKGNKGKFFVMELSFLGWIILAAIPTGIVSGLGTAGVIPAAGILFTILVNVATLPIYLWLEPYMQLCFAGFYDTMNQVEPVEPVVEPLDENPQF